MAAEGHEVASHTWDHKILTLTAPGTSRCAACRAGRRSPGPASP
ncbi:MULTISPECIES: polysaccharide deacetylase family protein [Streptomyces]|nr:polysaccharide deacetylase family protein [Streptomyces sp. NEAU-HV9]